MQNLITSAQIKEIDRYTIKNLPISSISLMENAAQGFVKAFKKEVKNKKTAISILCGQGNNGGDGLAIARLLNEDKYENVTVYLINFANTESDDYRKNLKRLHKTNVQITAITHPEELKILDADIIIDAILGSGLNKPLQGKLADMVAFINDLNKRIVSVDVPTGLNTEGPIATDYKGIAADLVICFQRPKINFFFPESIKAMERFKVVPIGLIEDFIQNRKSEWKLTTKTDIQELIRPRKNFSHKGTYGHALIVAGSNNTMGAALLAANACLHTGAGLTTLCLPQSGLTALNTSLPEVMALPRNEHLAIAAFEKFSAIAFGPGLGTEEENENLLEKLTSLKRPLVVDADGLTILSKRKDLFDQLPHQSILTPHMKEFDRLFGEHQNWWERLQTARNEAKTRRLVIVLKNQFTFVCLPTGEIHINPTGNPAMASGGMGDVLTGIITALLAQSYSSANAAVIGLYIHGKAGNDLAKQQYVITATELTNKLASVLKQLSIKS